MRKLWTRAAITLIILTAGSVTFTACYRNPATAQPQGSVNLVDNDAVVALSNEMYTAYLSSNPPIYTTTASDMVRKVGNRMAAAAQQYLLATGRMNLVAGYRWEFTLIDNDVPNAWCMPGGRVVIYNGILPYSMTEGGLATVMGHEMGHIIAWHGLERLNQTLQQRYGGVTLSAVVRNRPAESLNMFNDAYGIGATSSASAFTPLQENEADEIGMYIMALAGYSPNEAIAFWQRIAVLGGYSHPDFINTHPDNQSRIANVRLLVPKAWDYYNGPRPGLAGH